MINWHTTVFAAILVIAGCDDVDGQPDRFVHSGCDKDVYSRAVLRNVHIEELGGCDWLRQCTRQQVSEVRIQTKALREWAKTLTDRCTREAYEGWAWFYDYEADKAEHEMKTHETRDMYDAIGRKQRSAEEQANEIAPTLPVPPK